MDEEVKRKDVVNGGGDRGVSDGGDGRRAPTVARYFFFFGLSILLVFYFSFM